MQLRSPKFFFQVALKRQQATEDAIALGLRAVATGGPMQGYLPPGPIYGMSITEPLTSENDNDSRDQQTQDGIRQHSSQEVAESDGEFMAALMYFSYSLNFHQMTPKMSKLKYVMAMMILSHLQGHVLLMHQVVSQATLLHHPLAPLCLPKVLMKQGTRAATKQRIKNQVTLGQVAYLQLMS